MGTILAGCSAEPTETDLARALQSELDELNAMTQRMVGEAAAEETALHIVSVSKIGCSAGSGRNRYLCDAEVVMDSPEAGRRTLRAQLQMLNEKQGWTIVKQLQETPDHR